MLGYTGTARFWFESFQDWQSEFMLIALMIGASVYLREQGPPGFRSNTSRGGWTSAG